MDGSHRNGGARVKLRDVAEKAGVSVTTASLVLTGKGRERRISAEVEDRVREAAVALDYAPNLLVRSLQRGRTHVLSFYSAFRNRRMNDLYMDRLSTGLQVAAGSLGYDILFHCDFRRSADETYRFLNGGRADGLLFFAPAPADPLLPYLRASRLPVVLVNGRGAAGLSCVEEDMADGLRQVAERLVALGHRRVAALTDVPAGNQDAPARVARLREELNVRGAELDDRHVFATRHSDPASYERALRAVLDAPEGPTALFCWNDLAAYRAAELCDAWSVPVPERLSIVGYDGVRWPAATRHHVVSVAVDLGALAEAAVGLLDQYVHGAAEAPVHHFVPVSLSAGTTLGPAANRPVR